MKDLQRWSNEHHSVGLALDLVEKESVVRIQAIVVRARTFAKDRNVNLTIAMPATRCKLEDGSPFSSFSPPPKR